MSRVAGSIAGSDHRGERNPRMQNARAGSAAIVAAEE